MPRSFHESGVAWEFVGGCRVLQYDQASWYRRHFNACADSAAVDFVAVHQGVAWLIEVKDFSRSPPDPKKGPLWEIVTTKVRDTLAGILAGAMYAGNGDDGGEKALFKSVLSASRVRVVFHCEHPAKRRRLFASSLDAADSQGKLRGTLRAVDKRMCVVDCLHPMADAPWTSRRSARR